MSDITSEQLAHLASLSRIALTDEEIQTLTAELGAIVDAIAKVAEVAGPDVPATSHPVPLENELRPDVVGETLSYEQVFDGAPSHDGTRFKVAAILGEEQ